MDQTDDNRRRDRDFRSIRWGMPLVAALGLAIFLASDARYWYVGVVVTVVFVLGYVQILRLEREQHSPPSRRAAAKVAKAFKPED